MHDNEQDDNIEISFLIEKERELSAFLKYADLANYLISLEDKKTDRGLNSLHNSDLLVIEKAMANEIAFSFYINLSRNELLNYTDEGRNFLLNRDTAYAEPKPADFLEIILKSDREINDKFLEWLEDILNYQKQSTGHTEKLYKNIQKWNKLIPGH
jgi:hypothetical protein